MNYAQMCWLRGCTDWSDFMYHPCRGYHTARVLFTDVWLTVRWVKDLKLFVPLHMYGY